MASSFSTEPRAIKTTDIKLNSDSRPADAVKTETVTLTYKQRVTKKKKSPSTTDNSLRNTNRICNSNNKSTTAVTTKDRVEF